MYRAKVSMNRYMYGFARPRTPFWIVHTSRLFASLDIMSVSGSLSGMDMAKLIIPASRYVVGSTAMPRRHLVVASTTLP